MSGPEELNAPRTDEERLAAEALVKKMLAKDALAIEQNYPVTPADEATMRQEGGN